MSVPIESIQRKFLTVRSPYDTKRFETALLFLLLGCEICRKDIDEVQIAKAISTTYEIGLSKTEERILEYRLFGPDRGAVDSPSMKRLFKSTLELGYPQPGETLSMICILLFTKYSCEF